MNAMITLHITPAERDILRSALRVHSYRLACVARGNHGDPVAKRVVRAVADLRSKVERAAVVE